ncbi:hypothetical protein BB560_003103 [Smittium megazygosporum]|uniref:Uncharacterized protein n=1 Tax=Smittium megazygosporum TaxID=133381 RepID=A0A2T9ZD01_9FUNG|nr:hypothetical protein BB560_003103 [Smittium megazygosporum]
MIVQNLANIPSEKQNSFIEYKVKLRKFFKPKQPNICEYDFQQSATPERDTDRTVEHNFSCLRSRTKSLGTPISINNQLCSANQNKYSKDRGYNASTQQKGSIGPRYGHVSYYGFETYIKQDSSNENINSSPGNKKTKYRRASKLLRKISSTLLNQKSADSFNGDSVDPGNRYSKPNAEQRSQSSPSFFTKKISRKLSRSSLSTEMFSNGGNVDEDSSDSSNSETKFNSILPSRTRSLGYANMLKNDGEPCADGTIKSTESNPFVLKSLEFDDNDISVNFENISFDTNPRKVLSPQPKHLNNGLETTENMAKAENDTRSICSTSTAEIDSSVIDIYGPAKRFITNPGNVFVLNSPRSNVKKMTTPHPYVNRGPNMRNYSILSQVSSKQSSDETLVSYGNSLDKTRESSGNDKSIALSASHDYVNSFTDKNKFKINLPSHIEEPLEIEDVLQSVFSSIAPNNSAPNSKNQYTANGDSNRLNLKECTDLCLINESYKHNLNTNNITTYANDVAASATVNFQKSASSNSFSSFAFTDSAESDLEMQTEKQFQKNKDFKSMIDKKGLATLIELESDLDLNDGPSFLTKSERSIPENSKTRENESKDSLARNYQYSSEFLDDDLNIIRKSLDADRIRTEDPETIPKGNTESLITSEVYDTKTRLTCVTENVEMNYQITKNHTEKNKTEKVPKLQNGFSPKKAKCRVFKNLNFRFNETVVVYETFNEEQYDRTGNPLMKITPEIAYEIKRELNEFKFYEMPVHKDSVVNTHYII